MSTETTIDLSTAAIGSRWVRRDGRVVTPVELARPGEEWVRFDDNLYRWFDGRRLYGKTHDYDIVAPAPEPIDPSPQPLPDVDPLVRELAVAFAHQLNVDNFATADIAKIVADAAIATAAELRRRAAPHQ